MSQLNQNPKFDFAKQSTKALSLLLDNALSLYGVDATIYRAQTFNNGYEPYAAEFTENPVPVGECKILISQPFQGIILSDYISLADKVESQVRVTTNVNLQINDQLSIVMPDSRQLNLRVTEPWAFASLSSNEVYRFNCIVT